MLSQRLDSIRNESAGPIYPYSLTTSTTSTPPTATTIVADPIQVLGNGELGVANLLNVSPGIKEVIKGQERYPSIASLRAGGSARSTIVVSLHGTTPAGQAEIDKVVQSGDTLTVSLSYEVTSARLASITTHDGTFKNIVGVHIASYTLLNTRAGEGAIASALADGLAGVPETLYFAKGVGEVSESTYLYRRTFDGCHG